MKFLIFSAILALFCPLLRCNIIQEPSNFEETATVPLYNLEIDWIIQGYSFGFHGFMVEFLGFMKGIEEYMPQLSVMQSSFRKTMTDSPVDGKEYFTEELFPEEAKALLKLMGHEQRLTDPSDALSLINFDPPVSSIFKPPEVEGVCDGVDSDDGDHPNAVHSVTGILYNTTALNRDRVSKATTAKSCCHACLRVNNCLAWAFSDGCSLKGSVHHGHLEAPITSSSSSLDAAQVKSGRLSRHADLPVGRVQFPKVRIYHGTTCIHKNITALWRDIDSLAIGRYMVERSNMRAGLGLDDYAVLACAGLMDEVWVPTEWHRGIFRTLLEQQGVYNKDIFVIPEAVDTTLFDPGRAIDGGRYLRLSEAKYDFQLLSIFKWEHRKGWDVLLTAYWRAFSPGDNVVLRLRTYIPASSRKKLGDNVAVYIREHAREVFGKSLSELAPVVWERGLRHSKALGDEEESDGVEEEHPKFDRALTREQMRDLLASADAFVLPTRGEGWGLPIAEAMAMALPTIVTNATGPTAYTNAENAYVIPVEPGVDKLGYAQPSVSALTNILLQVHVDMATGEAARRGTAARKTMQAFSPRRIVALMVARIRDIVKRRGWMSI